MAAKPKALCGAYAFIECYGRLAVPVEVMQYMGDVLRIDHQYTDGKTIYSLSKDQELSFKLINAEQINAMKIARKLED